MNQNSRLKRMIAALMAMVFNGSIALLITVAFFFFIYLSEAIG